MKHISALYFILIFKLVEETMPKQLSGATYRNCEEWRLKGYTRSAYFYVDPLKDGNSFLAYCDMTSRPAQIVFNHDIATNTKVGHYLTGNFYTANPQYGGTVDQISNSISLTSSCQQYIKLDCEYLRLRLLSSYSYWRSRDSTRQYYWGSANAQSQTCACGLTSSCDDSTKLCNCMHTEDYTVREDSGNLDESNKLPVTQVRFRMTKTQSKGNFTLGPLICVDVDPRSFIETPSGIAMTLILCILSLLFITLTAYACYKKRPCCRRQNKTPIEEFADPEEKLPRSTEIEEKTPYPNDQFSVTKQPAQVREPLHSTKKQMMSVHDFPLDNHYKPGELARYLGCTTEDDLETLRMILNMQSYDYRRKQAKTRTHAPSQNNLTARSPPPYERHLKTPMETIDTEENENVSMAHPSSEEKHIEKSHGLVKGSQSIISQSPYEDKTENKDHALTSDNNEPKLNVWGKNHDNVLLVQSVIQREQAEKLHRLPKGGLSKEDDTNDNFDDRAKFSAAATTQIKSHDGQDSNSLVTNNNYFDPGQLTPKLLDRNDSQNEHFGRQNGEARYSKTPSQDAPQQIIQSPNIHIPNETHGQHHLDFREPVIQNDPAVASKQSHLQNDTFGWQSTENITPDWRDAVSRNGTAHGKASREEDGDSRRNSYHGDHRSMASTDTPDNESRLNISRNKTSDEQESRASFRQDVRNTRNMTPR